MPQARLGFFRGSQAVDFSSVHPDVVGILLEFRTAAGEPIAITINDSDADQLSLQLEALLDELANRRAGLPITPELWELDPAIDPDSPFPLTGDSHAADAESAALDRDQWINARIRGFEAEIAHLHAYVADLEREVMSPGVWSVAEA